jgi:hypothetical protein
MFNFILGFSTCGMLVSMLLSLAIKKCNINNNFKIGQFQMTTKEIKEG